MRGTVPICYPLNANSACRSLLVIAELYLSVWNDWNRRKKVQQFVANAYPRTWSKVLMARQYNHYHNLIIFISRKQFNGIAFKNDKWDKLKIRKSIGSYIYWLITNIELLPPLRNGKTMNNMKTLQIPLHLGHFKINSSITILDRRLDWLQLYQFMIC